MLNTSDITYSTQSTGPRTRVLATQAGATRAVVTLDTASAHAAAVALGALATSRLALLLHAAQTSPGQVCQLRRTAMGAVSRADARVPISPLADLVHATMGISDAERRALTHEVGRVLAGTCDVLVPVALSGQFGEVLMLRLANDWLAIASDEDIITVLDPYADSGITLIEGLLTHLRCHDVQVEQAVINEWVDVTVDQADLLAWAKLNRPHLTPQLDELLADD